MDRDPIRLALIGLGRMGALHCAELSSQPAFNIVSVMDADIGRANQVVKTLGISPAVCGSVDNALSVPGLDACLIVTPSNTHLEIVEAALARGLHVICEKPLTLNPDADLRLGDEAAKKGLILQVGFWRRYSPPYVAARSAVLEGKIGRPLIYRGALWDAELPPLSMMDPKVSGGLFVDCGVHDFDFLEWTFGIHVVKATSHHIPFADESLPLFADRDNAAVLLELEDGSAAMVDLSRNARYGDDMRSEILGAEGAVFVDSLPEGRARLAVKSGISVIPGSTVPDPFLAGIALELPAFAEAITGRGQDAVPGAFESSRALRIGQAATRSTEIGAPVWIT